MYAYRPATGPSNGKGVYGCLLTRRITTVILKTIDLLRFLPPSDKVFEQLLNNQGTQFMEPYFEQLSNSLPKTEQLQDDFDQAHGGLERSIGY